MSITLGDAVLYLKGNRDDLDKTLSESEKSTQGWAGTIGSSVNKLIGGAIVGAVAVGTSAIVGLGVQAFSASTQINQVTNDLQSGLNVTREEAERLGEVAVTVFKNNFGDSIADAGQAVENVRKKLGDLSDDELTQITIDAFKIRDAFDVDVADSVAATSTLMKNFGLTSKEATDFIAKGFQDGLPDDFLDSINEYSTQFSETGATAEQFFSVMKSGAAEGVLGTDKAADMLKEFRLRLLDGSKATNEALQSLFGSGAVDFEGGMAGFFEAIESGQLSQIEAFDLISNGLASIDNESTQIQLGAALMGTQFEDMGSQAALAIDITNTKLTDLMGATDALDAQYDNLGSMWEGFKRRGLLALRPVGDKLLEIGNRIMPRLQTAFDWFESVLPPIMTVAAFAIERLFNSFEFLVDMFSNNVVPIIKRDVLPIFNSITEWITKEGWPVIQEFGLRLWDFLQPLIRVAGEFVSWKDVLVAVGSIVLASVIPALAGMAAAAAPVIATGLAIAAAFSGLIALFSLLRNAWERDWHGIRTTLTEVWENTIEPSLFALWEWLKVKIPESIEGLKLAWSVVWPIISGFLNTAWNGVIKPVLVALWEWLEIIVPEAIDRLKMAWSMVWPIISEFLSTTWNGEIKPVLVALWDWLSVKVPEAIAALQLAWSVVWPIISEFLSTTWNGVIKPVLVALWDWLKVKIPEAIEASRKFFNETLIPAMRIFGKFLKETILPLLLKLWTWLKVKVPEAIDASRKFFNEILLPAMRDFGTFLAETVLPLFFKLWEWLGTKIPEAIGFVMLAFSGLGIQMEGETNPVLWALKNVLQAVTDTINLVVLGAQAFASAFEILRGLIGQVSTILKASGDVWAGWKNQVSAIIDLLIPKFNEFFGAVSEKFATFSNMLAGVKDVLGNILESIVDILSGFSDLTKAKGTLQWIWDTVSDILGKVLLLPDWLTNPDNGDEDETTQRTMQQTSGFNFLSNQSGGEQLVEEHHHYHLTINTSTSVEPIIDEFNLMKARRSMT